MFGTTTLSILTWVAMMVLTTGLLYLLRPLLPVQILGFTFEPKMSPATPAKQHKTSHPELALYKRLYYQLHNLEQYPNVLPEARAVLLSIFAESLSEADGSGIIQWDTFDEETLRTFVHDEDRAIMIEFERYLEKRAEGGDRQLFQTVEEARTWLIQKSPSKLVDGAWLGHINKVSTPFSLRPITKNAWQVMSEELGDGDITKNHAYIYRALLEGIGARLPAADSAEFVRADFGAEDVGVWKGAVAQLLISLFPSEFLPEILGFNLHFERLTRDTLRAARELKELNLDSSYFLLHISIDNADSGHTAMALQIVVDLLHRIEATEGAASMQRAWRGVQVGYLLSESLAGGPERPKTSTPDVHNRFAEDLVKVFAAKADASAELHCTSRVRIGGTRLLDWLKGCAQGGEQVKADFLTALSQARPWIYAGDGVRSQLVKELEWKGKMFGAFTGSELQLLKNWIQELHPTSPPRHSVYWDFVGRAETSSVDAFETADILDGWPVISDRGLSTPWKDYDSFVTPNLPALPNGELPNPSIDVAKLLPIWLAHSCLLEGFVSVPIRTCSVGTAAAICVLRAQQGFSMEGHDVAGMDEVRRSDGVVGLTELGLEMAAASGLPPYGSLKEAVVASAAGDHHCATSSAFALDMLHWSARPVGHRNALLGMTWAFVDLHERLARNGYGVLSAGSRDRLLALAAREREALTRCRDELSGKTEEATEFHAAAAFAHEQIVKCFR